jgi:type VI secretion system protein ImpI/type VI secretion system protein
MKAIKYKGRPLDSPLVAVFDDEGGKLGRSSNNHFVLTDEDKFVSGEHAVIEYENGGFYYTDTSLNGTLITTRNQRIHRTRILLEDQDELSIGDYDLVLTITNGVPQAPQHDQRGHQEALSLSMFNQDSEEDGNSRMEEITGNDTPFEYPDGIAAKNSDNRFEIDGSFAPPKVVETPRPTSEIPDNLSLDDFFGDEPSAQKVLSDTDVGRSQSGMQDNEPVVQHTAPKLGVPAAQSGEGMADDAADMLSVFLKAAGIEGADDLSRKNPLELMHTAGAVFRELVDGLMTVLRGRSELKSHLRVLVTTLKSTENNPLKFSPTVEEAMKIVLANNHPGFLNAVDAVHEGIENIKNHQLALNAGVQAALASILKRFDPLNFSEKFGEGIVLQKKAKCWDEYRQAYQQIVEEALENFFGEQFADAYEIQINKLRENRD